MRYRSQWVATLAVVACQFNSDVVGGGGLGESSGTTGSGPTTTSTTEPPGTSSSGASSGATTDNSTTTDTPSSSGSTTTAEETLGSSSTGPQVEPFEVGPFDEAVALDVLNSFGNDDDPTLRSDLLEMYFASNRSGSEQIFRTERGSTAEAWQLPELVAAFDTPDMENTPELASDGRTMMLSMQETGSYLDLYISTRENVDTVDWSTPMAIGELNGSIGDLGLVLTEDLLTGFFCRRDDPLHDIYRTVLGRPAGEFGAPTLVMSLGTAQYECNPWIDPEGTTIVYAGEGPVSDRDIMWAYGDGKAFDPAEVVDTVSTDAAEDDPWLSPDGGFIVFSRYVGDDQDLHWAQRP